MRRKSQSAPKAYCSIPPAPTGKSIVSANKSITPTDRSQQHHITSTIKSQRRHITPTDQRSDRPPSGCSASAGRSSPHYITPTDKIDRHSPIRFISFLQDKALSIAIIIFVSIASAMLLNAFKLPLEGIIALGVVWLIAATTILLVEYFRKRSFYRTLLENAERLDQAYLVLETLERPDFYDGAILHQALYIINKSIVENMQYYCTRTQEFQEYVEMWIHEVKTPLATLSLITQDSRIHEQIHRLDDYVEQILYFARAENAERDYMIKPVDLADIVRNVASRNREILLAHHIDFEAIDLDYSVRTDAKWLEFILNQILTNSIKYQSTRITIRAYRDTHTIILSVHDNGIGIDPKDLPRVFEKSFTGTNGRTGRKSTGMGLYIAKTLCEKMGHQIEIDSRLGQWTEVRIIFSDVDYYDVTDPE